MVSSTFGEGGFRLSQEGPASSLTRPAASTVGTSAAFAGGHRVDAMLVDEAARRERRSRDEPLLDLGRRFSNHAQFDLPGRQ
ncbi:hypothetical protein ACNOYE_26840 [Nannocystaceae bacterium ST9]